MIPASSMARSGIQKIPQTTPAKAQASLAWVSLRLSDGGLGCLGF